MKAIIIEEDRFAEVCDAMKAAAIAQSENAYLCQHTNLTRQQVKYAADEIHRGIHMVFVRWAQSHGASCVK